MYINNMCDEKRFCPKVRLREILLDKLDIFIKRNFVFRKIVKNIFAGIKGKFRQIKSFIDLRFNVMQHSIT